MKRRARHAAPPWCPSPSPVGREARRCESPPSDAGRIVLLGIVAITTVASAVRPVTPPPGVLEAVAVLLGVPILVAPLSGSAVRPR